MGLNFRKVSTKDYFYEGFVLNGKPYRSGKVIYSHNEMSFKGSFKNSEPYGWGLLKSR